MAQVRGDLSKAQCRHGVNRYPQDAHLLATQIFNQLFETLAQTALPASPGRPELCLDRGSRLRHRWGTKQATGPGDAWCRGCRGWMGWLSSPERWGL